MSKKKNTVSSGTGPAASPSPVPAQTSGSGTRYLPFILCALLGFYYWHIYNSSDALYQHDEAGHFIQMLTFWQQPMELILGMWSRGGYKILYALSSFGGEPLIIFTNILFTCLSGYVAYLIANHYQLRQSWLVIILFGLQPFIINLSFRCYAEIPTMFFATLMLYLYLKKKYIWVAVTASFLFTLRQEMAVFSIILGVFFLVRRQWLPFILLAWAPVTLGLLGWIKTGNMLFIVDMMVQGGILDTYRRMGFFYFWLMLPEIAGMSMIVLFLTGMFYIFSGGKAARKEKFLKYHGVLLLFGVYFLMHCVFTSESFGFGRSGGLGRFMIVISPCIAIIAQVGFHFLGDMSVTVKKRLTIGLSAAAVICIFLLSMDSIMPLVLNTFTTISLTKENLNFLFLLVIIMLLLVTLKPKNSSAYAIALAVEIFLYSLVTVKPLETNIEDETMSEAADWFWNSPYANRPLYNDHIMFRYYTIKGGNSIDNIKDYDSLIVTKARPGDLFLYENHYSMKQVSPQLIDSAHLNVVKQFNSQGGRFGVYFLEKK